MGIRTDMSLKTGTVFSEDILKIELCGPKEDYLTVIDVPGIFRNHTEGVTTKEDIALVNNLVRRYIKDKRTTIAAALSTNKENPSLIHLLPTLSLGVKVHRLEFEGFKCFFQSFTLAV